MPGSVANAVASDVMPRVLSESFSEVREPPILLETRYHDGSRQCSKLSETSRKRWQLTGRLRGARLSGETYSQLEVLNNFYQSHGTMAAFYFYNPFEPASGAAIGSNFDGTGTSTQGRYKCVFRVDWQETVGMATTAVPMEIQEVA